jgi:hypothetical protein
MKYIAAAVILLTVFTSKAQSSETETSDLPKTVFGIKTGFNISRLSTSFNSEPKTKVGFNLGIYVRVPITEEAFFRPEIYYSSQGQRDNYVHPYTHQSVGTSTTKINYINIPLIFEYGEKVTFQIGPQLGFLLSASEAGSINNQKFDDDLKDIMRSTDFSLVIGFGFNPGKHFNAGVRYQLGVTDIFDGDEDAGVTDFPDVQNRLVHFYVAYSF